MLVLLKNSRFTHGLARWKRKTEFSLTPAIQAVSESRIFVQNKHFSRYCRLDFSPELKGPHRITCKCIWADSSSGWLSYDPIRLKNSEPQNDSNWAALHYVMHSLTYQWPDCQFANEEAIFSPFPNFFLQGLKERTLGKGKTFRASRKIKKYDEDFDPKSFATETAVDVYTKAHMALSE